MTRISFFAVFGVFTLFALTLPTVAAAQDPGDWLVRLRTIAVIPDESSTIGTIGGAATVGNEYTIELDFSYFLTKNISAELILATSKHNIGAVGTTLGDLDLGSVWLLPPTLNLQYHFSPDARINPYVGAGLNLTLFHSVNNGPTVVDMDYKTAIGFSLQAGVDMLTSEKTYVNLDIKKLFLDTTVTIDAGGAGVVTADVNINPWIFGIGIGVRF